MVVRWRCSKPQRNEKIEDYRTETQEEQPKEKKKLIRKIINGIDYYRLVGPMFIAMANPQTYILCLGNFAQDNPPVKY